MILKKTEANFIKAYFKELNLIILLNDRGYYIKDYITDHTSIIKYMLFIGEQLPQARPYPMDYKSASLAKTIIQIETGCRNIEIKETAIECRLICVGVELASSVCSYPHLHAYNQLQNYTIQVDTSLVF